MKGFISICLKRLGYIETGRKIFYFLLYFSNDYHRSTWSLDPWASARFPNMNAENQAVGPPPLVSQIYWQGVELEIEKLGLHIGCLHAVRCLPTASQCWPGVSKLTHFNMTENSDLQQKSIWCTLNLCKWQVQWKIGKRCSWDYISCHFARQN